MPVIAQSQLPKPISWDEFEDICHSAFQLKWNVSNLKRYGRTGQKQHGVDIFGENNYGQFSAIQCKNTQKIDKDVILSECEKIELFPEKIEVFYIATAVDRDVNIQNFIFQLNNERIKQNKCPVHIVFWQDIVKDLSIDTNTVKRYYPQYFSVSTDTSIEEQQIINKDISNVTALLEVIDFDNIDYHLQWGAKYIHNSIIDQLEIIDQVINSANFHLQDQTLLSEVRKFLTPWFNLYKLFHSAPYNITANSDEYIFPLPGDFCRTPEEHKQFTEIDKEIMELRVAVHHFCHFINTKYHQIDLKKTSAKARLMYKNL